MLISEPGDGDVLVDSEAAMAPGAPVVLWLGDERAADDHLTGGKAAALARAAAAGLPTFPGFVITTVGCELIDAGGSGALQKHVRAAWDELSDAGQAPLVVRSSSPLEDRAGESMAGRYESVVDVVGWDAFVDAVRVVLDSRAAIAKDRPDVDARHRIAVVVQPLLEPASSGVLFGVDPVSGRSDRIVVSAVEGLPDKLVSGEVPAARYVLSRNGRQLERAHPEQGAALTAAQQSELAELAARVAFLFRGPQDIEWAYDRHGQLWLLQSRPVTTEVAGVPQGPLLGPGPVAETFPDPLSRLEQDLWVEPLRRALREAFRLTDSATQAQLDRSPIVACIGGRVAVDLTLFGERAEPASLAERLDPRATLRRLRTGWHVGRLRSALPGLAEDLVARVDEQLKSVPGLDELTDRQLVALLKRARNVLTAVHAHEVLVGLLVDPDAPRLTATSLALRILAHARCNAISDDEVIAADPVVLALIPPRIAPAPVLPRDVEAPPWQPGEDDPAAGVLREALRLRARWVQELTARAAWELGVRLRDADALDEPDLVRHLGLDGVEMTVRGRAVPSGQEPLADAERADPLPARFRLTDSGAIVPIGGDDGGGTGAGGGRASGRVHHRLDDLPTEAVLVVRTLDPGLASVLPRVAAIVAETGTVLSHVAILAREAGVPTVVGVPDATARLQEGWIVTVDGTTGDVQRQDEEEA